MQIAIDELIAGDRDAVLIAPAPQTEGRFSFILPGAFDPLHDGHRGMIGYVEKKQAGRSPVACELSIVNVDKPPLVAADVERRLAQIGERPVWLTRAATFVEKARLFPGVCFLVGADTVARIGDVRYYDGQAEAMRRALREIAELRCRFLVFGRHCAPGVFRTVAELPLPRDLLNLCEGVPEDEFRLDVSSTELRGG